MVRHTKHRNSYIYSLVSCNVTFLCLCGRAYKIHREFFSLFQEFECYGKVVLVIHSEINAVACKDARYHCEQ